MNVLQLASMVQTLGLSVNLAAIGPVLPLLDKKAAEINDADVRTVFDVLGIGDVDDQLISETAIAIQTSEYDKVSELLSDDKYIRPIVQKALYSNKRMQEKLLRDAPYVPVACPSCGRVNQVSRREAFDKGPGMIMKVNCLRCDHVREVETTSVISHGV